MGEKNIREYEVKDSTGQTHNIFAQRHQIVGGAVMFFNPKVEDNGEYIASFTNYIYMKELPEEGE